MMEKFIKNIEIKLPVWVESFIKESGKFYRTAEEKMDFVIELSKKNIEHKSGGPFGAAVFDSKDGSLIAAGVNIVTSSCLSIAHAEIIALMQAQTLLNNFDLGTPGSPRCELVSSTAPCAMCLGAVPWSGAASLVCGARDEDARAVGFDEGSKREDWVRELEVRGIKVTLDVLREKAADVLREYVHSGGVVYNGRSSKAF
ncbi:MAG: nucleoside deaminase [Chitinispirillales bacterium]|jgi:tRNA(Arg) A34 adenosine deaminase TadA|nr:nucleoside deaminase [Chitinispirillales bacterium]